MPITIDSLKFFASERMTDNSDGGGRMSATEIVSGVENSVFDDISDVDRSVGDISIRKVYALVSSADTDKYLDSGVIIFKQPADPAASVLAMTTGDFYDEREDIKNRLEQTITRGARWSGWLWGAHLIGQRVVTLWQRPYTELPTVGSRMELVFISGTVEQYSQFLWITKVTNNLRTITKDNVTFEVREVLLEIAEALNNNFTGTEPDKNDPSSSASLIYSTRYNAEAVPLYGIMPLALSATTADYSIKVDSLYAPIIPTAMSETALPDVNPGGDSLSLVSSSASTVSYTTALQVIKPDASMYLGRPAFPGTVNINVSGSVLTDENGVMKLSGSEVGTIDYGNGIIRWNGSCPNYTTASKTVTFNPAAKPSRVADTAVQSVTIENRGFLWVLTLSPIPAPGTLEVSYRVNNVWYQISDSGQGLLTGVDSSYGSGSLNFTTGTVTFTSGALPDVDSEIIYTWGTPVGYTARGGATVNAPAITGQTANPAVVPGSVTIEWTVGATTYTLTDSAGELAGTGGVGSINYATGAWAIQPTLLPGVNTIFSITYDYYEDGVGGAPLLTESFVDPLLNPDSTLTLSLPSGGLVPGSVRVVIPVESQALSGSYLYDGSTSTNVSVQTGASWTPGFFGPYLTQTYSEVTVQRTNNHSSDWAEAKVEGNIYCGDDGNGNLVGITGTINYITGIIVCTPSVTTKAVKSMTTTVNGGRTGTDGVLVTRTVETGFEEVSTTAAFVSGSGTVTVTYRAVPLDPATLVTETTTLSQIALGLAAGYGETITAGSTRFRIGTDVFVDTAGQIYRNPSVETGAGTLSGTIDRTTGMVILNQWTAGITNAVTLDALTTEIASHPVDAVIFRTPVSPVKSGTMQVRYTQLGGIVKSKLVDSSGILEDADCTINVNYPLGTVHAKFGAWKTDSLLTSAEKLEPWYNPANLVSFSGTLKIWKPVMVMADSIIYNAVAQTFLPPDSALLGIDASRLPPDGKGLIFRVGKLAMVHNTQSITENSLTATQVISCGRTRLYRVAIKDVNGLSLSPSQYTMNRELGTVTMKPTLDLTGLTAPFTVEHTVADLLRIVETDINGTITFNKPVSHTFPADTSYASGVLYIGTLQARVTSLFAQSTWTSVWSDSLIGSEPLAQFNDAQYPIQLTNAGAYPDRILVKFTSSTEYQVIGENLGLIGTGDITHDCSPLNTLTGVAYFTIPYLGWGLGWATGNCLRFNVISAAYPIDLIRAIQPSDPSGLDSDSVELLLLGNVDQ